MISDGDPSDAKDATKLTSCQVRGAARNETCQSEKTEITTVTNCNILASRERLSLAMACATGRRKITRRDTAYRPGGSRDWLKIKTAAWRATNIDRFEL
jgi:hypothetical protein